MAGTSPAKFVTAVSPGMGGLPHHHTTNEFVCETIGDRDVCGSVSYLVEPGNSQVPQFQTSMGAGRRLGWLYPTPLITFDQRIGIRLWNVIKNFVWSERWRDLAFSELEGVAEPYRSALHSLLVNIWSYAESVEPEFRDLSCGYIIEQTLRQGPPFAKWVDGLKSYLLTVQCGRQNLDPEIVLTYAESEGCDPKFRSLSHIFRANLLFGWDPPHPDIREITSAPLDTEDWALDMFRVGIKKVLTNPKYLFFVPNNDYNTQLKDNTKMVREGPQWTLAPVKPALVRGKSRVAFIPRELKEARAAVVEEHSSVVRIRWIDSEVRRVLNADRRSVMNTRPGPLRAQLIDAIKERTRFNHKVRRTETSERWAYCRDFKKEGITKPRVLLKIMLEELHLRFPSADAFLPYYFFDHWEVEDDLGFWTPPRGHGLGMANALTTLMQLGIEEMSRSRMEGNIGLVYSAYNNDDAALVFESEQHARDFCRIDWNSCDALGLKYKAKSTFIARQHLVLCEQYVSTDDRINDKTSFNYAALANLLKAVNSSHARNMCLSLNLHNVPINFAMEVVNYWGAVLFSNEFSRPRVAGGWFRAIERGVDVSMLKLNGVARPSQMEEAAIFAYRETALSFMPWRKVNVPSKRSLVYPTEWLEQRGEKLFLTNKEVFRPEHAAKEHVRAWVKFEEVLKRNFSRACSWWVRNPKRRQTWSDIYRAEVDARPKEDILPPIFERIATSSFEASFTDDVEFEHPYRAARSDIDLRAWKDAALKDSYPRRMGIRDQISIGSRDLKNFKKGPAQRALAMRHLYGLKKVPLKVWNLFLVPSEKSFAYWHNPFAVGSVADSYGRDYSTYIPTYESEEKKKLLDLRDSYYGRKLTWWEWMNIGQVHPSDVFILWLVRESWNTTNDVHSREALEVLIKGMKKYPGLGDFIAGHHWTHDEIADLYEKWIQVHETLWSQKRDREREKAHKRIMDAEMEKVQDEFLPEGLDEDFLDDFYASRNEGFHATTDDDWAVAAEGTLEDFFEHVENLPEEVVASLKNNPTTPEQQEPGSYTLAWEQALEESVVPEDDDEVAPWDEEF
jgi:hypothetical protein